MRPPCGSSEIQIQNQLVYSLGFGLSADPVRIIWMIICMGAGMKTNLKRKNYYLDEKKIRRVRAILGASTETEAIDTALNLVVFRREISVAAKKGTTLAEEKEPPSWLRCGIKRRGL